MRIVFIGCGNMGEAILSAVLDKKLFLPQDISVSDIDENRRQYIQQKYNVGVTSNNQMAITRSDVIILAVKPQSLTKVMAEIKGQIKITQLVISIIAGAKLDTLSNGLNHHMVARAMPNTPSQIGEGITTWITTSQVTEQQKTTVNAIFDTIGKEIHVDSEEYLDMTTAVSGSGPAYFFLFVEALTEAAINIGLPQDLAHELVLQTMFGSGQLIKKSEKDPSELRKMVTSPGGTTAEALLVLEKGGFTSLLRQALSAAHNKAKKLGEEIQ
ncbi:pyrroline-5-carboxylate reductase [Chloroflexota bacterium]